MRLAKTSRKGCLEFRVVRDVSGDDVLGGLELVDKM